MVFQMMNMCFGIVTIPLTLKTAAKYFACVDAGIWGFTKNRRYSAIFSGLRDNRSFQGRFV